MDLITSSSSATRSGNYVTMTKEQVRRMARQLPPHDSDARHCHGLLSDDDKRRLEEFRDSRYRDALGQGTLRQLETKSVCRRVRLSVKAGGRVRVSLKFWDLLHARIQYEKQQLILHGDHIRCEENLLYRVDQE